jgi:aminoacyl-tRNA hydrolase
MRRWGLARAKNRFRGLIAEGRAVGPLCLVGGGGAAEPPAGSASQGPGGGDVSPEEPTCVRARTRVWPRVAILCPQTYMNEAGRSVGPARGAFKLPLERVLAVHDEIDLPFGEIRSRLGRGLAGHNGLKSLARELGSAEFMRVRVGVGRPSSTDPEIVSAYVLGRFSESADEVRELVERACDEVQRIVLGEGE